MTDEENLIPTQWISIVSVAALRAFVFLLVAQSGSAIAQTQQPERKAVLSPSAIGKMIEGLGSDDFLLRQRSSEQLAEAGSAAIPLLESAQHSHDQEVRYRVTDILKKLLETDLQQRASRFLAMPPTSSDDCGFQHWSTFSQLAGTSREARSLLVAIHSNRHSQEVLGKIDLDRNASEISVDDRKSGRFKDRLVNTSVAVYAAEMYRRSMQPKAATADRKSPLTGSGVLEELSASAFESDFLSLPRVTVQQNEHKPAFLTLLTAWLKFELQSTPMTLAKLKIISAYRLSVFAEELAELLRQPQYPHKQAAIESLGKILSPADEEDQSTLKNGPGVNDAISQLKPFILLNEVLVRLPQAETKGPVEVTLGDIAFQLILHMQEKAPKDFGMSEAGGKLLLDNKSIFCFTNREAASESIQKWLANLDESQPNVDQ